ncbi:hypothetical protein [Fluviicola sp.]
MEALLIINSILVAVCLYFVKDFHSDFKEMTRKVGRLDGQVRDIHYKLNARNRVKQK